MQRTAPVAINNMRVGAGCTQRAYRFEVLAVQAAAGVSKGDASRRTVTRTPRLAASSSAVSTRPGRMTYAVKATDRACCVAARTAPVEESVIMRSYPDKCLARQVGPFREVPHPVVGKQIIAL